MSQGILALIKLIISVAVCSSYTHNCMSLYCATWYIEHVMMATWSVKMVRYGFNATLGPEGLIKKPRALTYHRPLGCIRGPLGSIKPILPSCEV